MCASYQRENISGLHVNAFFHVANDRKTLRIYEDEHGEGGKETRENLQFLKQAAEAACLLIERRVAENRTMPLELFPAATEDGISLQMFFTITFVGQQPRGIVTSLLRQELISMGKHY